MNREQLHTLIDDAWDEWERSQKTEYEKPLADSPDTAEAGVVLEEEKPAGPKKVGDTRVVRTSATGDKVYLLHDVELTKRWITSPEVLNGLGFSFEDVTEIPDVEFAKYRQSSSVAQTSAQA